MSWLLAKLSPHKFFAPKKPEVTPPPKASEEASDAKDNKVLD